MAVTYKTLGIILKAQSFKEADRLYTIYTQDYGKVSAIAKGVKKSNSKLAGHLEPLSLSKLFIAQSVRIDKIAGSQIIKSYQNIKNNLEQLSQANYCIEALDKTIKEGLADQRIFSLLEETLHWLNNNSRNTLIRHAFVLKLLDYQGLRPELLEKTSLNKVLKFILDYPFAEIVKLRIEDILWIKINQFIRKYLQYYLEDNLQSEKFLL